MTKAVCVFVFCMCVLFGGVSVSVASVSETDSGTADSDADSKSYGIFPVPVPFYSPETGWGIAASVFGYWNSDRSVVRPDTAAFVAIFTEKKQMLFGADIDKYFLEDSVLLEAGVAYSDWQNMFYGIGLQSGSIHSADYEEDFISVSIRGYLGPAIKIREGLYAGIRWSYSDTDIDILDNRNWMATSNLAGRDGGVVSGPGMIVKFDTRDTAFYPTKGCIFEAEYNRFTGSTGSDFVFDHFRTDYRHFYSFRENHILATQVEYEYSGGNIPFYRLPSLASWTGLRGIEARKYIDRLRYAVQAEYRFPVWNRFGGVIFAGAGQSFSSHADLFENTAFAGGFGFRYMLERKSRLNVRLDIGFDENGDVKFYFNLREAF